MMIMVVEMMVIMSYHEYEYILRTQYDWLYPRRLAGHPWSSSRVLAVRAGRAVAREKRGLGFLTQGGEDEGEGLTWLWGATGGVGCGCWPAILDRCIPVGGGHEGGRLRKLMLPFFFKMLRYKKKEPT